MQNTDSLSNTDHYKVSRKSRIGSIVLAFLVTASVTGGAIHHFLNKQKQQEIHSMLSPFSTEISIDDINDMNLILNDQDCSDTFFQEVAGQLREDGIQFIITRDGNGINENNSTIVTLDQQYSAGPGTIIFAPYDNARVGQSDSLALAMNTAFKQNGFIVGDILCGQTGYKQDEDGTVYTFFPTDTEEKIDEAFDSSFVTISFGTQNQNGTWVAKSIENGLARQNYHLKSDDSSTDLIYRANSGDSIEDVTNYFGTDAHQLRSFNQLSDPFFADHQTVVNPSVENMNSFDSNGMFQIGDQKTRTY